MIKAKKDYKSMSDASLDAKSLQVCAGMKNNPNYLTLAALVTAMETAREAYTTSLSVAQYGSREQKMQKNLDRQALIAAMDAVCNGVNLTTPGDVAKIATTNFTLSNLFPQPVVMQALKKFTLAPGPNPGSVIVYAVKGRGTLVAVLEVAYGLTIGADTKWTTCGDSVNQCTITGIPSGETVWVRARSVGRRGQVLLSSAIKIIAQ